MKGAAKVTSIEAVERFQPALSHFLEEAREALSMADLSMARVVSWIEHDQRAYWKGQLRRRQQAVERARLQLQQRQLSGTKDHKPDCIEQRKALRIARGRLEEAEEKIKKVAHWTRAAQRAVEEYRGQVRTFRSLLEDDPPRALVVLNQIVGALQSYTNLAPPSATSPSDSATPTVSPIAEDADAISLDPACPEATTAAAGEGASSRELPEPSAESKACEPLR